MLQIPQVFPQQSTHNRPNPTPSPNCSLSANQHRYGNRSPSPHGPKLDRSRQTPQNRSTEDRILPHPLKWDPFSTRETPLCCPLKEWTEKNPA